MVAVRNILMNWVWEYWNKAIDLTTVLLGHLRYHQIMPDHGQFIVLFFFLILLTFTKYNWDFNSLFLWCLHFREEYWSLPDIRKTFYLKPNWGSKTKFSHMLLFAIFCHFCCLLSLHLVSFTSYKLLKSVMIMMMFCVFCM